MPATAVRELGGDGLVLLNFSRRVLACEPNTNHRSKPAGNGGKRTPGGGRVTRWSQAKSFNTLAETRTLERSVPLTLHQDA